MSSIEKKITKLVKIAQNSGDESAFQKDADYLKFKSIKMKSLYSLEINRLIYVLKRLYFREECVFWYKRLLKITDMCNKEDRNEIFDGIIEIYIREQENELVVKYCKEALDNIKGTNLLKHKLEFRIGTALNSLKMYQDALPYFNNENLTYFINPHNTRSIQNLVTVISFYKEYIDCHMKNNQQSEVIETIRKVALCKLNSEDPNDVRNECMRILKSKTKNIRDNYCCVSDIADIYLTKCQLFKELGDMVQCQNWANFLPNIYHDAHVEKRNRIRKNRKNPNIQFQTQFDIDESLIEVINAILTQVSVMRVGSDTFGEPIFQKGLQY